MLLVCKDTRGDTKSFFVILQVVQNCLHTMGTNVLKGELITQQVQFRLLSQVQ